MKYNLIHGGLVSLITLSYLGNANTNHQIKQTNIISSQDAFKLVWLQEGEGCQNLPNDTANNGGTTYTCNGITQEVWGEAIAKNIIPKTVPVNVYSAYNQNPKEFKTYAENIYKTLYAPACESLPPITKTVCLPQAINWGIKGVQNRLDKLDKSLPDKQQAEQLINLMWADYQSICNKNSSQRPFCNGGWKNNTDNQKRFVYGTL